MAPVVPATDRVALGTEQAIPDTVWVAATGPVARVTATEAQVTVRAAPAMGLVIPAMEAARPVTVAAAEADPTSRGSAPVPGTATVVKGWATAEAHKVVAEGPATREPAHGRTTSASIGPRADKPRR
jgi:hypothetical protein